MFSRATLLLVAALQALTGKFEGGASVLDVQNTVGTCWSGTDFKPICAWCEEAVSVVVAGPKFAAEQRTRVVAPLGQSAILTCTVLSLLDKSVSWVRSRDLQILSHAGHVFTADARVSVTAASTGAGATRQSLHIERLRASDSGRYECQVNTEPKMSLLFNLSVVDEEVPRVVVSAVGGAGALGGAATLTCEASLQPEPRRLEPPALDVRWYRHGEPLNLQSSRGGVSLDTERWPARVVSRLTLAELEEHDAGEYECAAGEKRASAYLQVLPLGDELSAEAMQRDEAAHGAASELSHTRGVHLALLPALLLLWR